MIEPKELKAQINEGINELLKEDNMKIFMLDHAARLRKEADNPTPVQNSQGYMLPDGYYMNWHDYHIYIAEEIERKYGEDSDDGQKVCGDVKEQHDWANKRDFNFC